MISFEKAKSEKQSLAQQHSIELAMKTLQYSGFLRGPGLLQLETVQKYFAIIGENAEFKVHKTKVTDFCHDGKAS